MTSQPSDIIDDISTIVTNIYNAVTGSLQGGVDSVGRVVDAIKQNVQTTINNVAYPIGGVIGTIYDYLANSLSPAINSITDPNTGIVAQLQSGISGVIDSAKGVITDAIATLHKDIFDPLGGIVATIEKFTGDTLKNIQDNIEGFVSGVATTVGNAVGSIQSFLDTNVGNIKAGLSSAVTTVTNFVTDALKPIGDALAGIAQSIGDAIAQALTFIGNLVNQLVAQIQSEITTITATLQGIIKTILDTALPIIADAIKGLGDAIGGIPQTLLDSLIAALTAIAPNVVDYLNEQSTHEKEGLKDSYSNALTTLANVQGLPDDMRGMLSPIAEGEGIVLSIVKALSVVGMVFSAMGTLSAVRLQPALNSLQREILSTPLSPAEATLAFVQGYLTEEQSKAEAALSGVSPDRAAIMQSVAGEPLGLGEMLDLWNRGETDEETVTQSVMESRLKPKYTELAKKLRFQVPPFTDIIRMAVREAFSPEIAEAFGQFQDYPSVLDGLAQQKGVDPQWAKNYWAAHWDLPSATQGFEMLHRGLIDRNQLAQLLRANDVMPFWRDKLIDTSYNTLTRVDVRRMHQVGVLTDAELVKAYQEAGYSPARAEQLASYTKKANAGELKKLTVAERDLTKSELLSGYKDALINEATLIAALGVLGYDSSEVSVIKGIADFQIAKSERAEKLAALQAEYQARSITRANYIAELDKLGLPSWTRDKLIAKADIQDRPKVKRPDDKELSALFFWKLLTKPEYLQSLKDSGYSDYWANKLVQLEEVRGLKTPG